MTDDEWETATSLLIRFWGAARLGAEFGLPRIGAERVLTVVVPMVEARLRKQIAEDIEAESIPRAVGDEHAYNDGIRDAVRVARGQS